MQSDGLTPTIVEQVLHTGQVTNKPNGNIAYYDPVNDEKREQRTMDIQTCPSEN
jgi:hypothetical protein